MEPLCPLSSRCQASLVAARSRSVGRLHIPPFDPSLTSHLIPIPLFHPFPHSAPASCISILQVLLPLQVAYTISSSSPTLVFRSRYLSLAFCAKNLPFLTAGVRRVCHLTSTSNSDISFRNLERSRIFPVRALHLRNTLASHRYLRDRVCSHVGAIRLGPGRASQPCGAPAVTVCAAARTTRFSYDPLHSESRFPSHTHKPHSAPSVTDE